jgi:DNA-binding Lrp family transcriptional regulator
MHYPPDSLEFALLNCFQRDFPLVPQPYLSLAHQLGCSEQTVINTLAQLKQAGAISRIGAVFRPNVIGVSTLAAFAVPENRLQEVADLVSAHPAVNHNYQREHHYNLWFVLTAINQQVLQHGITALEKQCNTGTMLVLPLVEEYHIDLGFDLKLDPSCNFKAPTAPIAETPVHKNAGQTSKFLPQAFVLNAKQRRLVEAMQNGLSLQSRPYAALIDDEDFCLAQLTDWIASKVIRRFGVVVQHHALGYQSNAMVVFNIADDAVTQLGQRIACSGMVSLCYQRPRRLPHWPYNLFCMLHGKSREEVQSRLNTLLKTYEIEADQYAVLFCCKRYKQRGAHYQDHRLAGASNKKEADYACT